MDFSDSEIKTKWDSYITEIIDGLGRTDDFKKRMKELLKPIPKLTISSYKSIYSIEAEGAWNNYKSENRDIFSNLFERISIDLEQTNYEFVERKYYNTLNLIVKTLNKDFSEIRDVLISLEYCIKNNRRREAEQIKEELKLQYKKFVILYKKDFINKYINGKLSLIKSDFVRTENLSNNKTLSSQEFIKLIKTKQNLIYDEIKKINSEFNVELTTLDFENLIISILEKNDLEVHNILGIKKPDFYDFKNQLKALKRLRKNYRRVIKEEFTNDLIPFIEEILNNKNFDFKYRFTNKQLALLNDILKLMEESNSKIDFSNSYLFISKFREYTIEDKKIEYEYESVLKKVEKIKSYIFNQYERANELYSYFFEDELKKEKEEVFSFNDINYKLNNYDYIFNYKAILNLLINIKELELLSLTDYEFQKLKQLLVNDCLLAPLLYGKLNQISLSELINTFHNIYENMGDVKLNKENIGEIFKKCNIFKYATSNQVKVLGSDVVEKIVNNNQFIGVKVTDDDIKERLVKAVDLMDRAKNITKSSVPFNCDVSLDGINITRYLNNDSQILVSGIDTNSCFKLSANDNDLLYYCILNKNGFVLKFTDDNNKILGKAVCFRRNNILEINSIRNAENTNLISSKEQYDLYQKILNAIELYATKVIEETKNSKTPIDFVVANKAGILESSEFNDRYELLNDHLFSNPIDTTNDDWQEFVHTYDNCEKNYLQQADSNTIFSTDYGSYPVVMIKARDNMRLERLFDISYDDPEAIYERPSSNISFVKYEDAASVLKGRGSI